MQVISDLFLQENICSYSFLEQESHEIPPYHCSKTRKEKFERSLKRTLFCFTNITEIHLFSSDVYYRNNVLTVLEDTCKSKTCLKRKMSLVIILVKIILPKMKSCPKRILYLLLFEGGKLSLPISTLDCITTLKQEKKYPLQKSSEKSTPCLCLLIKII